MFSGHNYCGLFISFEGGEGGGKGTQIKLLKNDLDRLGIPYDSGREPGGTEIGEKIRDLLLDDQYTKNVATELFLFSASRSEFTSNRVIPVISKGGIFIGDRFKDSSTAYQGYAGGIELDLIYQIHQLATRGIAPDITYFLDVPPKIGLERAKKAKQEYAAGDSMEKKSPEYHECVRQGYYRIADLEKERVKVIDVTRTPEVCYEEIKKYLNPVLLEKYKKTI